MRALVAAVIATACGRIEFASIDARVDVAVDAPLGPFAGGVSVDLGAPPTAQDEDPSLRDDMLEIYFRSDRPGVGGTDIWRATRASTLDPWGPAENVAGLNTTNEEGTPELAPGGLVLLFNRNRPADPTDYDVYVTTRPSFAAPWGPPVPIAAVNVGGTDGGPVIDDGPGLVMIMHSTPTGDGSAFDLYSSVRASPTDAWPPPVALSELNTAAIERNGHLRRAGLELVFSSNATGNGDLYRAVRADTTLPFGAPALLEGADLASSAADSDPWLSSDLRTLYFSSGRGAQRRIYVAVR